MQDLATAAEQLKKALSAAMARKHNVRFDGSVTQLELTREHFEELTSELLERTIAITERTIATARTKGVEQFDDVLLVGGMTIMPAIARALKERFGLEARLQDPHLAVARGAALFALMKKVQVSIPPDGDRSVAQQVMQETGLSEEQAESLISKHVTTVVPRAFGLKVVDQNDPVYKIDPKRARQYISHLLTADTPLPADTGPQPFSTVFDNQNEVKLEVWEQAGTIASEELKHNTHIGEGRLVDLPDRPAKTPFEVVFHMTETGLLQVHAREADSGREVRFEIQIGRMDDAAVQEAADAVARLKVSGGG